MDDLISRQAAIDMLMKEWKAYKDYPYVSHVKHGLEIAIALIENKLPSAQRKGKWIYLNGLGAFECSVCGRQMVRNIFDYCPWCGARMEVEE